MNNIFAVAILVTLFKKLCILQKEVLVPQLSSPLLRNLQATICKSSVKYSMSGESRVGIGRVVCVTEIIRFLLHLLLELATSVLKFDFTSQLLEK